MQVSKNITLPFEPWNPEFHQNRLRGFWATGVQKSGSAIDSAYRPCNNPARSIDRADCGVWFVILRRYKFQRQKLDSRFTSQGDTHVKFTRLNMLLQAHENLITETKATSLQSPPCRFSDSESLLSSLVIFIRLEAMLQPNIFMAALCNRGAIIFLPCSFFPSFFHLSSIFFLFPRLISATVDPMSAILLHMAWP